jgi:uncharacterized HAD superfamily protein
MNQKQMLEFNQTAFNNAFNAMTLLQDQFERASKTMLEQANMPAEGLKIIENFAENYKSARQTFKKQIDDGYKQVEKFFVR